jgi:hypothetical protein
MNDDVTILGGTGQALLTGGLSPAVPEIADTHLTLMLLTKPVVAFAR